MASGSREAEIDPLDINYLFLRQQVERSRAQAATTHVAREIHEQLADQYERLIENATGGRISFMRRQRAQWKSGGGSAGT
jgi:hypothetical protein